MPTLLRSAFFCLVLLSFSSSAISQRAARRKKPTTEILHKIVKCELISTIEEKVEEKEIPVLIELPAERGVHECTIEEVEIQVDSSEPFERPEVIKAPPDCRETNPINMVGTADAYPYITGDGLRLYFTSNREGGHGRFFISTRNSVKEPFGKPVVLSPHLTDGYFAGTLTEDELTMVMVKNGDMFISIRNSTRDDFPIPTRVAGTSDNYHFGPSISPDGKEIIAMEKIGEKDITRVYIRTGTFRVEAGAVLAIPAGIPGPGQFSKDGLSYFFSIETETEEYLWKYNRSSLHHSFADLEELKLRMTSLKNNLQPSINRDGSILVFVTSPDGIWDTDDIVLVNTNRNKLEGPERFSSITSNKDQSMQVMNKVSIPELKVYPNPFGANLTIDLNQFPGHGTVFNLYDISGKRIRQEMIIDMKTNMVLGNLIPGIYIYQVLDGKGKLIGSGKLVRKP